jgi:hypothetical protein
VTLIPSWKIWQDVGIIVSQFESDDIIQRSLILLILACLLGFTIVSTPSPSPSSSNYPLPLSQNIVSAFESTYAQLIAFYVVARGVGAAIVLLMGFIMPHVKPIMTLNFLITMLPLLLWVGSIFVAEQKREVLIWIAITWGNAPVFASLTVGC